MSKKSLSSRLSRKDPDTKEFHAAMLEFYSGSDRVAAIMGAALVETNLGKILRAALHDPSEERALFHDEGAPFGTFKRKIVAARAMGLISHTMAADIDIIRDIRNQFAHALLKLDFENDHIKAECAKLGPYQDVLAVDQRGRTETRAHFEAACGTISDVLISKAIRYLQQEIEKSRTNDILAALEGRSNDILSDGPAVQGGVKD